MECNDLPSTEPANHYFQKVVPAWNVNPFSTSSWYTTLSNSSMKPGTHPDGIGMDPEEYFVEGLYDRQQDTSTSVLMSKRHVIPNRFTAKSRKSTSLTDRHVTDELKSSKLPNNSENQKRQSERSGSPRRREERRRGTENIARQGCSRSVNCVR